VNQLRFEAEIAIKMRQILSIPFIIIGIVLFLIRKRRPLYNNL